MRNLFLMILGLSFLMGVTGYLNYADINNCMDAGNTYEECERAFNR